MFGYNLNTKLCWKSWREVTTENT